MVAWNLFLSSVTFYLGPNQTLVVLNWEVWLEIIYKSNVIWYFICSFISSLVISQVYSRASCLTKRPEVDTRTFLVLSWCCLTPQTIPIVSWKAQWMTLLQGPDWAKRGNYQLSSSQYKIVIIVMHWGFSSYLYWIVAINFARWELGFVMIMPHFNMERFFPRNIINI